MPGMAKSGTDFLTVEPPHVRPELTTESRSFTASRHCLDSGHSSVRYSTGKHGEKNNLEAPNRFQRNYNTFYHDYYDATACEQNMLTASLIYKYKCKVISELLCGSVFLIRIYSFG